MFTGTCYRGELGWENQSQALSVPATGVGITGLKVYVPGCQLLGWAGRFVFSPNLVRMAGVHGCNSLASFKLV